MTQEQMLPCPFCGATEGIDSNKDVMVMIESSYYMVGCGSCGGASEWNVDRSIVVAAWNRRAESAELAALRARVAELELEQISLWHVINTQTEYIDALEKEGADHE